MSEFDTIRSSVNDLARDVARSLIRSGLIKLAGAILNIPTGGFGRLFVGGLLGTGSPNPFSGGGAAAPGRVAAPIFPAPQTVHVHITGTGRISGNDIVFSYDETKALFNT